MLLPQPTEKVRALSLENHLALAAVRGGRGDHWLHVLGKGGKRWKVTLPALARTALDQYSCSAACRLQPYAGIRRRRSV